MWGRKLHRSFRSRMSLVQASHPIRRGPMKCPVQVGNNRGVTYLALMFSIVLIGLSASAAARQWQVMVQREKEADLMAKGIEIQNALAQIGRASCRERV